VALLACRELDVRARDFLAYAVAKPLLGSLVPIALLVFLKEGVEVSGFAQLFASGIAMVFVFAIVWVLYVYRDDPHLDLRRQLGRVWIGALRRKTP
jgi:hypothetical protein